MRGKCSSIVVFLGGLPAQWGARDLKDLVRTEIRSAPAERLQAGFSICECSILRITDLDTGWVERHGLVEIRPPLLALQVIDRLDGRLVDGHRISARRYRQRSPMGSPRPRPTGDGISTSNAPRSDVAPTSGSSSPNRNRASSAVSVYRSPGPGGSGQAAGATAPAARSLSGTMRADPRPATRTG